MHVMEALESATKNVDSMDVLKSKVEKLESTVQELKVDLEDATSAEQLMNLRFQLNSLEKKFEQINDARNGDTLSSAQVDMILKVDELKKKLAVEEKQRREMEKLVESMAKRLDEGDRQIEALSKRQCEASHTCEHGDKQVVQTLLSRIESLSHEVITLRGSTNLVNTSTAHTSMPNSKFFRPGSMQMDPKRHQNPLDDTDKQFIKFDQVGGSQFGSGNIINACASPNHPTSSHGHVHGLEFKTN